MFLGVDNRLRRYGTGRSGCRPVGHGSLPQFSTQRPVPKSQAHALGLSLARSALSTVTFSSTNCHFSSKARNCVQWSRKINLFHTSSSHLEDQVIAA